MLSFTQTIAAPRRSSGLLKFSTRSFICFVIALAILVFLAPGVVFWPCNAIAKDAEPTSHVYEGTVGAVAVVMALDISGNSVSGKYFYRGKWFDIDLQGDAKKGVLQLESDATGDKLTLKPNASRYAGGLTTAKRKTLAVELRAIGPEAASNVPADVADGLNLYEKIARLRPDAETAKGRDPLVCRAGERPSSVSNRKRLCRARHGDDEQEP
jgi:hypothetical protein